MTSLFDPLRLHIHIPFMKLGILKRYISNGILELRRGAPWSGGLIRHVISLTAPRVEGSNPGRSTSFIRSFNATTRHQWKRNKKGGGSGESRKKDRQAFQECLRDSRKDELVRFEDD